MKWENDAGRLKGLEIVVVGAGIIGLFSSYFLNRLGAKVTLVDQALIGQSIPNVGLTKAFSYCKNTQPGELTEHGLSLAQTITKSLGYFGSVRDVLDEVLHKTGEGCVEDQPVYLPDFARDVATHCRKLGVRIVEANVVRSLLVKGDVVHGVDTLTGPIFADEVVICAGLHCQELLRSVGLSLKLESAENRFGVSPVRQGVPGVFIGRVPITPTGRPYIGRPAGIQGLYLGVGHDTNPAAAIAVGHSIANAMCRADHGALLALPSCDRLVGQVIHSPT